MYKDSEKQKQANRDSARRYRANKGMTQPDTTQGMTQGMTVQQIKDLSAQQARQIIASWAEGKGTAYQQSLSELGIHYSR